MGAMVMDTMVILTAMVTITTVMNVPMETIVTGTGVIIMIRAVDPGMGDELTRHGAREGHII
jgi:hypothetical protein